MFIYQIVVVSGCLELEKELFVSFHLIQLGFQDRIRIHRLCENISLTLPQLIVFILDGLAVVNGRCFLFSINLRMLCEREVLVRTVRLASESWGDIDCVVIVLLLGGRHNDSVVV